LGSVATQKTTQEWVKRAFTWRYNTTREWIEPQKCRFVTIWERIYTKKTKKTRWKTIDFVLRLSVRLSGIGISTLRIGIFSSGFFLVSSLIRPDGAFCGLDCDSLVTSSVNLEITLFLIPSHAFFTGWGGEGWYADRDINLYQFYK
jgi:hypothetical protein